MKRAAICHLFLLLCLTGLRAQTPIEETASNFVNYNVNQINRVRAFLPHYNGNGRTVSIKEFRFDSLDIDFSGRYLSTPFATATTSPHAALMATIIGGGGNSDRSGLGVAWNAQLTSSSFLDISPDEDSYFEQYGISVQNHSYGIDSIENYYGILASSYDLQVSRLPQLLHVFSIGNMGMQTPSRGPYAGLTGFANMTGEFKLAKNVLTLGVIDSFGIIDPYSSHGPAFDGRIKPELVAFGIDGASAAAALASGSSLLLQQAYEELEGELPPTALVKALLINGAEDLGLLGPDHTYGFGNINLFRSLQTLLAGRYWSDTLSYDGQMSRQIQVPDHVRQLKISLVWTDPPAAIAAEKALVNDIDMRLIRGADGQSWLPFNLSTFPDLDSLSQPAIRKQDHLNNVEQIVLEYPLPGTYEITLEAYDFGVSTQSFQLVYDWDTLSRFHWTFPVAGDVVVPNDKFYEQIRWSADDLADAAVLSYTLDGVNWTVISEEVDPKTGYFQTFFPSVIAKARFRMQIGAEEFLSDTFTISPRPRLDFVLNCPDSIAVTWQKFPGIDTYRFFRLGDQYMEPFMESTDTFVVLRKTEIPNAYLAIAPVMAGGSTGTKSLAYNVEEQGAACYSQGLSGRIVGEEAVVSLSLSPAYGVEQLTLERLLNGQWVTRGAITQITAAGNYDFTDTNLAVGSNTYRVRVELTNGQSVYSDIITLFYVLPDQFVLYPNPFSRLIDGNVQVHYNTERPEEIRFQLFTALGANVMDVSLPELQSVIFYEDFQSGMYFYRFVRDETLLEAGKLVVR